MQTGHSLAAPRSAQSAQEGMTCGQAGLADSASLE